MEGQVSGFNLFEESLKDYHIELWNEGIAFVRKIPDPVNIIRPLQGGKVIGARTAKEWVDWGGFLPGGRAVWHESKETKRSGLYRSLFKPHQLSFLILAGQHGCLTFVTIRSSESGLSYAVPWERLADMPLRWEKLEDYQLRGVRWAEVLL
jgi:penicillin-binding protein-related factor A (putative recombinase)